MEVFVRVLVSALGVLLLGMSFTAFVKKRMTEGMGLAWGIFSILLILLGAVPPLAVWARYIVGRGAIALFVLVLFGIFGGFSLSQTVSKLVIKNRELAMQVSLLNQEHEHLMRGIRTIEEGLSKLPDEESKG